MMNNGPVTSTTQKGVITRILGNLITVWPLNVHQEKALVFQDVAPISSQYLRLGDWIQMEVESGDVVVYREKIEPVLQTSVTLRGNVQVKTLLYFPNGINRSHEHVIGYSDDVGQVGIFFPCPGLRANFSYNVWVSRPLKKFASLEKRYNVHWCVVRQTIVPLMQDCNARLLYGSESVDYSCKHVNTLTESTGECEDFNNTLTENTFSSRDVGFSYALNFNNNALRRLYSVPEVREAVYQCSSDFAHSIETYLSISCD
ncbi:unnamed protein product [Litomosoides sigmodontis]|uniref:Uncharacterized protein n=1 Tax=Litomosoides sigmodontis TaxID=42156 RepID=A0A3P6V2L3_LITSI|nr:unnamed protein product [Litomosoides sigmodontis]